MKELGDKRNRGGAKEKKRSKITYKNGQREGGIERGHQRKKQRGKKGNKMYM